MGDLLQVKGLNLLTEVLQTADNKGSRYEPEGAALLKRTGTYAYKLTQRVNVDWGENLVNQVGRKTDIDVVGIDDLEKLIYYQFKRSKKTFRTVSGNEAWIARSHKDIEAKLGDYSGIKYATPDVT